MGSDIDAAFRDMPRQDFLPEDIVESAELDMALPIGFGSTNSQPSTVAMMLDWLDVGSGQKVLDVGSGSGWTSALLAHLTGKEGSVTAVEIVPELVRFGRDNCDKAGIRNVTFHQAEAREPKGWPAGAPYDRILVSAAAQSVPPELTDQLAKGGCLVVPVDSSILVIDKDENGKLSQSEHPGFAFVPLA